MSECPRLGRPQRRDQPVAHATGPSDSGVRPPRGLRREGGSQVLLLARVHGRVALRPDAARLVGAPEDVVELALDELLRPWGRVAVYGLPGGRRCERELVGGDTKDGKKFRDAYFSTYPGVWRQGDWIVMNPKTKGLIILGRR